MPTVRNRWAQPGAWNAKVHTPQPIRITIAVMMPRSMGRMGTEWNGVDRDGLRMSAYVVYVLLTECGTAGSFRLYKAT